MYSLSRLYPPNAYTSIRAREKRNYGSPGRGVGEGALHTLAVLAGAHGEGGRLTRPAREGL